MTPEQYQRAKEIFLSVCDLPAAQAAAKIAELGAGDEDVRGQALRMLEGDRGAPAGREAFLLRGVEKLLETAAESDGGARPSVVPETIGPFRVLRRVGSGGMGDVYEAQQESPRRRVAVKLMRSGLESQAMLRRFRREIEFAGRLSHPGIAQVFEAGVATIGAVQVPYFAMEFIHGSPLTTFATEHALSLQQRLRMFASICDTVQYAHQQGVIHRDLKPANILVQEAATGESRDSAAPGTRGEASGTRLAGEAQPRILDFGIARAVESEGAAGTLATQAGQIIGTIAYMSPEQIGGRTVDVDTRTDVYSLGVILFELLTGRLPFETEGLSIVEVARIRAQEAPRRLSAVDGTLRGDLDTIVGKALETDRVRRYASASELGMDVRRYLNSEVIAARPATALYQLRMFARRNRAVVAAAGLALLALVGGIIATSLQARAAGRERDVALRKTAVAEGVSSVLLDALTVATPNGKGRDATVMDAVERIEAQANSDTDAVAPEVRAVMLNIIGIIHREQGDLDLAETRFINALEIRRRVLDPGDPNLADSLNNIGLLRKKQGRMKEATEFYQEAIDLQRRSTFRDDDRLLRNLYNLATARTELARTEDPSANLEKAKALLDESLLMQRRLHGEDNPIAGLILSAQARVAMAESRVADARALGEQALAVQRKHVGPVHPNIMNCLSDLSVVAARKGEAARSIGLIVEADLMAGQIYKANPTHPNRAAIRAALVGALQAAGQTEEAERLEKDVLALPTAPAGQAANPSK